MSRLARNAVRVVQSEELWLRAWGVRAPLNAESLHVRIYRLRRRLAPFGIRLFGIRIETTADVGYRLLTHAGENAALRKPRDSAGQSAHAEKP